jgi:hypothetical protein
MAAAIATATDADFARSGTPVVVDDPFFLLVTVEEGGKIQWTIAQRSNMDWAEPPEEGPFFLDGNKKEVQQIVSPETVAVSQEMIRAWGEADAAFWDFCASCGSRMNDYQEMKAGNYESDAQELAKPITAALEAALAAPARAPAPYRTSRMDRDTLMRETIHEAMKKAGQVGENVWINAHTYIRADGEFVTWPTK